MIKRAVERSYLLEVLRQITSYFPEDLRQISSYLPEDLRQITSSKFGRFQNLKIYLHPNIFGHKFIYPKCFWNFFFRLKWSTGCETDSIWYGKFIYSQITSLKTISIWNMTISVFIQIVIYAMHKPIIFIENMVNFYKGLIFGTRL